MKFGSLFSRILFLFVLTEFVSACATTSQRRKAPRQYNFLDAVWNDDSYSRIFDKVTKEKQVHSEFEPVMTVYATYWSPRLQEAFTHEMARQYQLTEDAEKKIAAEQKAEDKDYFVFVLSASTREPEWNDFEKKHSMWRIFIENPDGTVQVDHDKIEAASHKDERAKYFYKNMSNFGRTYRVRFPKKDLASADMIRLLITGPRGSLEYEFVVQPQTSAPSTK
ncbi:MAG: hypothetical protein J0L93_03510 [Deltaproteobacteria bacterium]|nr:hypothetical protein [Deltaproteobacteria bacterium]